MKKLAIAALVVLLGACSKNIDVQQPQRENKVIAKDAESCHLGLTSFNLTKRNVLNAVRKGKPVPKADETPYEAVILLDFDGHVVTNTSWNTSGDINCAPANLSAIEMAKVIDRVAEDFRPFNVTVTTDEAMYLNANVYKRMRVIITETWEWFGQSGGTSFTGSFTWGDNTPSFVFSSLLSYNEKKIGEASSHELGHTLGLRHQAGYDGNCTKTSEYNSGTGTGEIGWAPIMGNSYNQNISTWHHGPNPYGCTSLQNDLAIITSILPYKKDDYSNTINGAFSVTGRTDGIISTESDVDVFNVSISATATISVVPFNLGAHAGANMDMKFSIYDSNGALINTASDPTSVGATTVLGAGKYYIGVETEANAYCSRYGMLGKYQISIQ